MTTTNKQARFVTGSVMHHILSVTGAGSLGLAAIFMVDFADIYFISLLGEVEIAAAVGYAGSILAFTTAIGVGLSIAAGALVSRRIGAGESDAARRMTVNVYIFTAVIGSIIASIVWFMLPWLLSLLGAHGRTHDLAHSYLQIIVPTMPVLAAGISSASLLRALGDAKRSMYITLYGAIVNGLLDPLFIFSLGLGIEGAAWASVVARITILVSGLYGVLKVHAMTHSISLGYFSSDLSDMIKIAVPAVLTNAATPFGMAYVTASIAEFGDGAVAGWAVVGRLIPVAFGGLFALSGAVGPIIGQNLGARRFDRLRSVMTSALIVTGIYSLGAWFLLAILNGFIIDAFQVRGDAAELIRTFCLYISPLFSLLGGLFVANAAFNNLGRAHYSTIFSWGRATVGNVPFVIVGGQLLGVVGVIAGNLLGSAIFGMMAIVACYRLIDRLAENPELIDTPHRTPTIRWAAMWPFTTQRGQ
jgi:putative MATE family efflux protein